MFNRIEAFIPSIDMQSLNPTLSLAQTTHVFKVSGMTCDNCVRSVEAILLQQPGVISATVDLATATVECEADIEPLQLAQRLTEAGFPSQLTESSPKLNQTRHWAAIAFFILVVFFNICLNLQVLTVGLAYFYNPEWWNVHVWLVRGYSGVSLILLAGVYSMPFPRRVRSLTSSMPILLLLQFLTIHLKAPIPLAVVHPLIGFTLFTASTTLVHRVNRFLFPKANEDDI
jgi:copper chaperone CopZ